MISILLWIAVLGALADIGRFVAGTVRYPKEPYRHCPRCGTALPEDPLKPCSTCGWERPKKPKPPIGAIILLVICGAISGFGLYMDSLPPPQPTRVPTSVYSKAMTSEARASAQIAMRTALANARPPQLADCMPWQMVQPSMQGDEICVWGVVTRVQEFYGASQLRLGASDEFFFSSGSIYYPGVGAGDCVYAIGPLLRSAEDVPYINVDEALYECETWMR